VTTKQQQLIDEYLVVKKEILAEARLFGRVGGDDVAAKLGTRAYAGMLLRVAGDGARALALLKSIPVKPEHMRDVEALLVDAG
jgi:hypothetical protein